MRLCGKPMSKAQSGAGRGFCTRRPLHGGKCGNEACWRCGVLLSPENATPYSLLKGKAHWCRKCKVSYGQLKRREYGVKPMKHQRRGEPFTFACGCAGILPQKGSNGFAILKKKNGRDAFSCRVHAIISGSQRRARDGGYEPIPKNTPHAEIRQLMQEPNCVICRKPLLWESGTRSPHMHHDHFTGKIFGFSHLNCNYRISEKENRLLIQENIRLRQEIYRLRERIKRVL